MGHKEAPLDPPPREVYGWQSRFDDPYHAYRTIYSSEHRITAIREVVQDFRPNTKVKADLSHFGANADDFVVAGEVPWSWRSTCVLAPAHLHCADDIVDLEDVAVRSRIEAEYADLLSTYGMAHLDVSEVSSKKRIVTQTIGRGLYDGGAGGIRFASNTDQQHCYVLFEERGHLEPADGDPEPLTEPLVELLQVCSEWDLVLRTSDLPNYVVQGRPGSRLASGFGSLLP